MKISDLSNEELTRICSFISGKIFKKYYQENPRNFNDIHPGFRPNAISDEKAESIARENIEKPFISDFIIKNLKIYTQAVDTEKTKQVENGIDGDSALLAVLSKYKSSDAMLYFLMNSDKYSEDYVHLFGKSLEMIERKTSQLQEEKELLDSQKEDKNNKEEYQLQIKGLTVKCETIQSEKDEILRKAQENEEKTENEIQALKDEISDLNSELLDFKNRAEYESDEVIAQKEGCPYSSFCIIVKDELYHMLKLRRIADVQNELLVDKDETDMPTYSYLHMAQDGAVEGSIGVWDWNATAKEDGGTFVKSYYNPGYQITEMILLENCSKIEDVAEEIKKGVIFDSNADKIFFAYRDEENTYCGLLCKKSELEESAGHKYSVKTNVSLLPMFKFNDSMILPYRENYYLRKFNLGIPQKIIRIIKPQEIIKRLLLKRITWGQAQKRDFLKKEYQRISAFISNFITDDFIEEVAEACNCDKEKSQELIQVFLKNADDYLNVKDFDSEAIYQIAKNSDALLELCSQKLKKDWELENQENIANAKADLESIRENIGQANGELLEIQRKCEIVQTKEKKAREAIKQQNALTVEVEKNVQEKMKQIKQDVADFISDTLFQFPIGSMQSNENASTYEKGEVLSNDDYVINNDYNEFLDTLIFELAEAGVANDYCLPLASYLYSAYIHKTPVLLAGPNSLDIANAFSIAMSHSNASTLNLNGAYNETFLHNLDESEKDILIIQNPFCSSWKNAVLKRLMQREKFYILTTSFPEEILIEPQSTFQYMLPLLTDPLLESMPTRNYVGGVLSDNFKPYETTKKVSKVKYMDKLSVGFISKTLLEQISSDMHGILKVEREKAIEYDLFFLLLPYAYATNQIDRIQRLVDDAEITLSKEVIQKYQLYLEANI